MIFLFLCILTTAVLLMELGRWCRIWWRSKTGDTSLRGSGTVEAAVFGLMGLLIAFTFYGADTRFESRRNLLVDEVNAIDTAYLRLDLLPANTQPKLKEDFRRYVSSRLAIYEKIPDWETVAAVKGELQQSKAVQREIWTDAVAATKQADSPAVQMLVIPAIDHMIDIGTAQIAALQRHPPAVIWVMLALTLLGSCVLAGFSMSGSRVRDWVHIGVFSLLFSAIIFVDIDFEYPRMRGFIHIHEMDQMLLQTLNDMK